MKLADYKSIQEISDRELMECIFANQLYILRKIDFLSDHVHKAGNINAEPTPYDQTLKEMIEKVPTSIKRINEYMSQTDEEKGKIRFE